MHFADFRDTLIARLHHLTSLASHAPVDWAHETLHLKPRTLKALDSDTRHWLDWWTRAGLAGSPYDSTSLALYIKEQEVLGLKPSTIARRLQHLQKIHGVLGWPDPLSRQILRQTIHAKNIRVRAERPPTALGMPLRWAHIQRCIAAANTQSAVDTRNIAVLLVMHETLARVTSVLGHRWKKVWHVPPVLRSDLETLADGTGAITLSAPPNSERERRFLSALTMQWISASLHFQPAAGTALFMTSRGRACTSTVWKRTLQPLLQRAGIDPRTFGVGSARLGMARDLLDAGAHPFDVRDAGRWSGLTSVARLHPGSHERDPLRCALARRRRSAHDQAPFASIGARGSKRPDPGRSPYTGDLFASLETLTR